MRDGLYLTQLPETTTGRRGKRWTISYSATRDNRRGVVRDGLYLTQLPETTDGET